MLVRVRLCACWVPLEPGRNCMSAPDMGPAGAMLTTMPFSRLVPPMQLWLPGRDVSAATRGALEQCAHAGTILRIYW